MILYNRPQLIVLLLVVVTAGLGLGVSQWRRAYPELSERIERFDRTSTDAGFAAPPSPSRSDLARGPGPAQDRPADTIRVHAHRRRDGATHASRDGHPSARHDGLAPAEREAAAHPVDVNRASEDELRALPGVGPVLAARIVEARERGGPFASLDDLRRVRGLGRAKLERLARTIALSP